MKPPPRQLDLVRLDGQQRRALLHRLEPPATPGGGPTDHDRRVDPRWTYQPGDVAFTVEHPGGNACCFRILARNLSAQGMAFIHGGFIYPGSRCECSLELVGGGRRSVGGRVVGCRHVEGALHEVRICFDEQVDPRQFITHEQLTAGLPGMVEQAAALQGCLLLVGGPGSAAKLVSRYLAPTPIVVKRAACAATMHEALAAGGVDVLAIDLDRLPPSQHPPELLESVQRRDLSIPVIAMTGDDRHGHLTDIAWAGADEVLVVPFRAEALYEPLLRWKQQRRAF